MKTSFDICVAAGLAVTDTHQATRANITARTTGELLTTKTMSDLQRDRCIICWIVWCWSYQVGGGVTQVLQSHLPASAVAGGSSWWRRGPRAAPSLVTLTGHWTALTASETSVRHSPRHWSHLAPSHRDTSQLTPKTCSC